MLRWLKDLWRGPAPDMRLTLAWYNHHKPFHLRRPGSRMPATYLEVQKIRDADFRERAINEARACCAMHDAGYDVPEYAVLMAIQLLKEVGMWRS